MKIIVCLKAVANPDVLAIDLTSEKLINSYPILDQVGYQILEEGLRIREKHGGEVMALGVAPDWGEDILQGALLYGADTAIRIWDDTLAGGDTFCIAQAIKPVVQRHGFDLILCGSGSSDTGSEFMVSALACLLDIPSATRIISLAVEETGSSITVHKKLLRGKREEYLIKLPAIIGLESGINNPRYVAPFSRTYQTGREKKVVFARSGLDQSRTQGLVSVLRFVQPQPRVKVGIDISSLSMQDRLKMMRGELGGKKEIFEGTPQHGAEKIMAKLEKLL